MHHFLKNNVPIYKKCHSTEAIFDEEQYKLIDRASTYQLFVMKILPSEIVSGTFFLLVSGRK